MQLELPREDVHLWLAFTDDARDGELLRAYRRMLTPQELSRGERFRFEHDRERYWLTRALVRVALSRYANVAPQDWSFETNAFGRPHVVHPDAAVRRISFNLSHTDGLIVLAVTRERAVGVDVERADRKVNLSVADHYFSPAEAAALGALEPGLQHGRFLDLWTLKESYIKARGMGLSIPLDRFSFDLDGDGIRLSFDAGFDDSPSRWSFLRWRPSPAHVAAVCLERAGPSPLAPVVRRIVPLRSESLVD